MSEVKTDSVVNVSGDNDSGIDLSTNDVVAIKTADSERLRVDASGKVGIGTTSPDNSLHVQNSDFATLKLEHTNTSGTQICDVIGESNGTQKWRLGKLSSGSDAFMVQTGTTERIRIDSSGRLLVGTTDTALYNNTSGNGFIYDAATGSTQMLRDGGTVILAYRASSDGKIIGLLQNGSEEGTISVSGTTVSYNGGHLARWSQLADNTKDTSIVKGTVMTNLDQMAVWTKDGVTEDNEQLNCMALSSVEGDANVAGVFVNWDYDDDDFNDMNIAMTGDMVIRIAQGTTVARGDLLMSAGDGTAKPQGDDIVRSKTIAKVTSTNVSHTYDDGSYLVPCVLMAC